MTSMEPDPGGEVRPLDLLSQSEKQDSAYIRSVVAGDVPGVTRRGNVRAALGRLESALSAARSQLQEAQQEREQWKREAQDAEHRFVEAHDSDVESTMRLAAQEAVLTSLVADLPKYAINPRDDEALVLILQPDGPWIHVADLEQRVAAARSAQQETKPCRVCGGGGFIAEKRFIDDGAGEVDSCPACAPNDSDPMQELLAALDELYPLADNDKRVERAGRTALVLKRWIKRESEALERFCIDKAIALRQESKP